MNKDTAKTKKTRQAAEKAAKKPIEGDNIDYAVTTAKLSDLIPDDKNFNKGTEFGQHLIEKSLRENGAGRSILLDKNNRIIAGNKTTENAANIDMDDVIIVETDGTKLVAVKRTDIDLDSEQGRQMALADNATSAANLQWDEDQLRAMQQEMDNFDPEEWGIKWEDEEENEEKEIKEDEFDETEAIKALCQKGDIWQLGEHRLMCGDSSDAGSWLLLLDGQKGDMVFTDPPYGVSIGDKNKLLKEKVSNGKGKSITTNIKNDTLGIEPLYKLLVAVMSNLRENCKDDASYFITAPQGGVLD